jgi:hypothetical protein
VGINLLLCRVEGIRHRVFDAKNIISLKEQSKKDDDLEKGLSNDISPHNGIADHVSLCRGHTIKNTITGRFSSECQSSEGVHDYVDPQHLSSGERGLTKYARAGEDNEHCHDVYS